MLKKNLSIVLLLVISLSSYAFFKGSNSTEQKTSAIEELHPTKEQQRATSIILANLSRHYQRRAFDDELSVATFNEFLKTLDFGHNYFTQADISEFEQYRQQLDDSFRKTNLEPGFAIFNRYQSKLIHRLEWVISTLENNFDTLQQHKNDSLVIDREKLEWAKDEKELDDLWRKRLLNQVINMQLSDKPDKEAQEVLVKRYKNQLNRAQQTNNEDVYQLYVNALTQNYDPHTVYFSPRRSENFNINMSLQLQGIGAELSSEDGYTKINRLIPGGPAFKSGQLGPNDLIIGVAQDKKDMVDVVGWRLDEVVQRIRGPKDSVVRLEVLPGGNTNGKAKIVAIQRDTVKLEEQAAKYNVIEIEQEENAKPFKLGVIQLSSFYLDFEAYHRGKKDYRSATRDVARILSELEEQKVDAVAIDLRDNGGGSLSEANSMVGLFIQQGPTVLIRDAGGEVSVLTDEDHSIAYSGPLAVMINRRSASASEIFAGAIQDYGRGIVVGETSFGKGTVQHLKRLNQGQLKITQAKFYRVSGVSNQHKGIIPDVVLPSLIDHDEEGESALPNALPWDSIRSANYPKYTHNSEFSGLQTQTEMRQKTNAEFVFIEQQLKLLQQEKAKHSISLNLKKRIKEQEQADQQFLSITNERNQKLGRETYADAEIMRDAEKERRKKLDEENAWLRQDPYAIETAHIMSDALNSGGQINLIGISTPSTAQSNNIVADHLPEAAQ